jgi:hypothetical protein
VFVLSVWLMILSAVIFAGVLIGAVITERRLDCASAGNVEESPLTVGALDGLVAAGEEPIPEPAPSV